MPIHPSPETQISPSTKPSGNAVAGFLAGIFLFMHGLGFLGTELHRIAWRVKARFWYQQGVARVEKNEIYYRDGAYELETTYHVELDGKIGKSTARLDSDGSSSPTSEEAEAQPRRLPVGSLQPCWYWPQDPENYHVLAPQGLRLGAAWVRLLVPAVLMLVAWELTRWSYRKLKREDVP